MTIRRAIEALTYFGFVLATVLLATDIVIIYKDQPVEWDTRGLRIVVAVLPWLIAVLSIAGGLLKLRVSPRSHAPVWWLGAVLAAYSCWLAIDPVVGRRAAAAVAMALIAAAVVVLDITELSTTSRSRRARVQLPSEPTPGEPSDSDGRGHVPQP